MNGRMTRGWRSNSNFKSIPSHQKGGQKVVWRLVEKCTVSRRSALGRLHKLCSGAWKWHFWIISSVSPKGTTKQCTFEKRDSPPRRHSGQRSPSKEMISAYECMYSSALMLEVPYNKVCSILSCFWEPTSWDTFFLSISVTVRFQQDIDI